MDEDEQLRIALALSAKTSLPVPFASDEEYAIFVQEQELAVGSKPPTDNRQLLNDEVFARTLQDAEMRGSEPSNTIRADKSRCSGCGKPLQKPLFGGLFSVPTPYISALGNTYHPGCLQCHSCRKPLAQSFAVDPETHEPYHTECLKALKHPKCCVCMDYLPSNGAQIVWKTNSYWKEKFCPKHETDGTERCNCCNRMKPRSQTDWIALGDNRTLCHACLTTGIISDTSEAGVVYQALLDFFSRQHMPVDGAPPIALVENAVLNDASATRGNEGPVFHTRGICLTEQTQTFTSRPSFGSLFGWTQPQVVHRGPLRHTVTAILVLNGLPYVLTASIMAHELLHAWVRLSGFLSTCGELGVDVEEGLAQLMALLWLDSRQKQGGLTTYEFQLVDYLMHQIHNDPSPIYGDSFRAAYAGYRQHGMPALLEHIRLTGTFPYT